VSAHTKAIVVGRQIDRKIVARTSRFPFNKKVGQLLIEHGVICECAHSPIIQSVNTHIMRAVAFCSAKILIFNFRIPPPPGDTAILPEYIHYYG
jgi:hypothetical protein